MGFALWRPRALTKLHFALIYFFDTIILYMKRQKPFRPFRRGPIETTIALFFWIWRELRIPILVILGVTAFGVVGYWWIEGWNIFDALYMTVITLSTTGFLEVHEMSHSGRVFTMLLLFLGVAVVAGVFTTLTQKVIQRQFSVEFQRKRIMDAIHKVSDHAIVCGYGRLARVVSERLRRGGMPVVVIEKDELRAQQALEAGHLVLQEDASNEEVLLKAGVTKAMHLISLLPKDADNLYVILTSRELAPHIDILSRAEDETGEKRLKRAGANRVISPYRVGGQKIADGILKPHVSHFLDLAFSGSEQGLEIEQIRIPDASPLNGMTLQDAAFRQRANVIIAAIINAGGEMVFNPAGNTAIEAGTTFIALGTKDALGQLESILLQG